MKLRRGTVRNKDGRGIGTSLLHGVCDGGEDRLAQVLLASLLGVRAANNVCACCRISASRFVADKELLVPYSIAWVAWKLGESRQ